MSANAAIWIMSFFIVFLLFVVSFKDREIREAVIMSLLLPDREMYGLDMVKESRGVLKRGVVYVDIERLEKQGVIISRQEQRAHPSQRIIRKLYRVNTLKPSEKGSI